MRKLIKTAVMLMISCAAFALFCAAADGAYISNQSNDKEYASLGDVITAHTDDLPDDVTVTWFVNGVKYGKVSDRIEITSDLLGASVYADISYNEIKLTTNTIKVKATAPTVSLSASSGDYSAYLSWTSSDNGAEIEEFEISYCSADSPDMELGRLSLPANSSSVTLSGLSGGIEHVIRITAKNSAGSTTASASVTPNDPDLATVTAVKNEIEASSVAIHMNLANTKEAVSAYLKSYFGRYSEYGVRIKDVIITDFTAAEPVRPDGGTASAGRFTFILEIEKGDVSLTTKELDAEIDNRTSTVYLSADKFSVMTNEKLSVTATAVDIDDKTYSWYGASSETDKGELIKSSDSNVCDIPTDKPGELYIYCVCGGVSSSKVKFTVTEPFTAVSDIELSTDIITASEAEILRCTVYPSNAANKNIVWSIENDGGCLAELSGRTITAYKPGVITAKATIENGLVDGNFEKIFYITVKERSTDQKTPDDTADVPDNDIRVTELDCTGINGIEAITVTAEKGMIQITPVLDETVKRILSESNIEAEDDELIGAVKFVYEKGAIAHDTQIKIKGYDKSSVRILSVNSNGGRTLTEQKPDNGVIYGNAVSPDTVILLKEKTDRSKSGVFPTVLILIIPAASAAVFIAYAAVFGGGKRNKRRRDK